MELATGPKVDASLTTGHADFTIGGDCCYDSGKGAIDRWAIGGGYSASDYQVAVFYAEKGDRRDGSI